MRYDLPNGLYFGQITLALSYPNMYRVQVYGYNVVDAVSLTMGADIRVGHRGGINYPAGAHVVIMIPNEVSEESNTDAYPPVILGAVAPFTMGDIEDGNAEPFGPNVFQQNSPVDINNNIIYKNMMENAEAPVLAQDRSYNRFMDAVPGDFCLATPLGGVIHLGDFMARIGSAPCAHIATYTLEEAVDVVAKNYNLDLDTYTWQKYVRGDKFLIIEGLSLNTLEALGGYEGVAPVTIADTVNEGEQVLESIEENQAPLLREQNLRGSDVDGEWKSTSAPQEPATINTFESAHVGLFSEKRRIDGILRVEAAKEIAFRKTPVIRVAEPRLDYDTNDRDPDAELPPEVPPWEELDLTEDEYRAVYDIVSEAGNEIEDLTIFMKGLRQDAASDIWLLETNAEVLNKLFGDTDLPVIPALGEDEVEYAPDTAPSMDVEITPDRIVKIFKNSSVFIMEDDGGIVLGDGYGAEIRMNKGNITITSAADIKINPGRDLQVMAPGNTVIKSGKHVEVTSTTKDVVIKAEENAHILGGNGGSGATVVESLAVATNPTDINDQDLLDGKAYGSGVIIKANGQVATYANSIYMGGRDTGSPSKTGTAARCDITLNAGTSGGLLMHSGSHTAVANTSMAVSMVNAISGLFVNNSRASVVSPGTIDLAGSAINIDKVQANNIKIPKIIRNDVGNRNNKNINITAPDVYMQGNLLCKGLAGFGGSVISSQAGVFKSGANSDPIPEANFQHPQIPASQSSAIEGNISSAMTVALQVANAMVDQYGTLPTYSQQILGLAFPSTESDVYKANNYMIRNAMWQDMLDSDDTWTEKPVKHDIVDDTYPFPGNTAYEKSDAYIVTTREGEQTEQKLETYKVNTKGLD